jgi:hypothetical protein
MNPGHPLRYTKGNKMKNVAPKPVLPAPHDMPILRRATLGYIIVTMVDGEPQYNYEDGSPVTLRENRRDNGKRHFDKLVAEGWLVGDRDDSLFPEDPRPQIYRARR